jgi:uncharacterized protein (TIGR02001 family)
MIKSRIALAAALCAVAGGASAAGFTVTPALTTDYDFRGISQTDESETFQLGLNYGLENGVYIGAWGSEVDFGSSSDAIWEADAIVGYAFGDAKEGVGYDVGIVGYFYPSSSTTHDTYEIYAGVSKGWFSGKLYFAPDYDAVEQGKKAFYADTAVAIPLPNDFTLGVHAGYSFGSAWGDSEHLDYSVGVTKPLGQVDLNLKYVNSNDYAANGVLGGRNAWIATLSTVLPWGDK